MIGETLGNYRILQKIGEGGMGTVYRAEHRLLGHSAAIKLLLPELSHNQELVNRLFNEARAASAIAHPGIVRVFDFGYHRDHCAYLVMELLSGESLDVRLARQGRLGLLEALRIAHHCASTLAAAHVIGVIHRDLKPDNVFLVADPLIEGGERAKILDFGIAKLLGHQGRQGALKTRTGCVMGTPVYMSPEQCRNAGEVDHRADIYSLGCVLFHLLCGRPPFADLSPGDTIASHLREPAPAVQSIDGSIPAPISDLVAKTLIKDPRHRFATMSELADELARHCQALHALELASEQRAGGAAAALGATDGRQSIQTLASQYRPDTLAAAPDRTTLAAAAAEKAAPSRLRRGWTSVVAFVSAVLVGCVFAALIAENHTGEPASAAAPDAAFASEEPARAPAPPALTPPEEVAEDRPGDTGASAAEPAREDIVVEVTSEPPGARVFAAGAGEALGTTPYRYTTAPTGEEIRLRVEKPGFEDGRVSFTADRSKSVRVALDRSAPRQRDRAGPSRRRGERPRHRAGSRGSERDASREAPDILEYR